MHIEVSSISCGARRLVIDKKDTADKEQLLKLLKNNKNNCAIIVTGVLSQRRDMIGLLADNDFKLVGSIDTDDTSVMPDFAKMAALIMPNYFRVIDPAIIFEQFVENTVNNDFANMASLMLHHGNEIIGNLNFYVYYCAGDVS